MILLCRRYVDMIFNNRPEHRLQMKKPGESCIFRNTKIEIHLVGSGSCMFVVMPTDVFLMWLIRKSRGIGPVFNGCMTFFYGNKNSI